MGECVNYFPQNLSYQLMMLRITILVVKEIILFSLSRDAKLDHNGAHIY